MNSFITYEDGNIAWLTSDSMLSWVTTSVYERFAGGGHMSGMKLVRGYREPKQPKQSSTTGLSAEKENSRNTDKAQPFHEPLEAAQKQNSPPKVPDEPQLRLERKLSSIITHDARSDQRLEEDAQKFSEEEIRHDYLTAEGESQKRGIQHLILVTHGIGQRLSLRYSFRY